MDFSGAAVTYVLLIIPTLFSLAVIGQGIYKTYRGEKGGSVIVGFGVVFIFLIIAAYLFFIK